MLTLALFQFPLSNSNFEKFISRCHNAKKIDEVNKSTIVNKVVPRTLQRNITHLAVITRETNIKLGILKGVTGKEPEFFTNQTSKHT